MKKIIITESQYNALLEKKRREKAITKKILEDIDRVKSRLNEGELLTEAITDVIRRYWRKGLLTTAVLATLLSQGVSAQTLTQAGVPQNQIEMATKNVDAEQKQNDDRSGQVINERVKFADNVWSIQDNVKQELDSLVREYTDWQIKQKNPAIGNNIQIGVIGTASKDIPRPVAEIIGEEEASKANEFLAKWRASETARYLVYQIVDIMRNEYGIKNFKLADSRIGDGTYVSIGFRILKEGDVNQNAIILFQYGNIRVGTAERFIRSNVGTQEQIVINGEVVGGVINDNNDLKGDPTLMRTTIQALSDVNSSLPNLNWIGN